MNWSALFDYRDGHLFWLKAGPGRQQGKPAGSTRQEGYRTIEVGGKKFRVHRLIWEMHFGSIPQGMFIDHIDANPGNNRIENLRLVDAQRNDATRSRSNSQAGWKGVIRRGNRYQTVLQLKSTNLSLGMFDNPEDAATTYNFAAYEWFGAYARFNLPS